MEIEVKIKINDSAIVREKILGLGFSSIQPRVSEKNTIYDTPGNHLKQKKQLLRLRQTNDKVILTFKAPPRKELDSKDFKVREEIEVLVSDFENMRRIINGLGYGEFFIYEKYREIFEKDDVHIMLDETPMGSYVEIEGTEEAIDRTAQSLGWSRSDYITSNYLNLYRRSGGYGHMQFQ